MDIGFCENKFMRESLVDGVYELCVGIITLTQHLNVSWQHCCCKHLSLLGWLIVVASTAAYILSKRWTSLEDEWVRHWLIRASTMATGLRETASAPSCHLPGQCWILKEYLRYFSFSLKRHGLCNLLRSLSPNIPVSGWWSVITNIYGQPKMNIRHFSSAQVIAAASPSIGAYWCSALVQNLLPANKMCHPSRQHISTFSVGHVQYFCNYRKPMPSLLQSGARQVTLLMSKMVTTFFYQAQYDLFRLLECFFKVLIPNKMCVFFY